MRRDFLLYLARLYKDMTFAVSDTLEFRLTQMGENVGNSKDVGYANRTIAGHMRDAVLDSYERTVQANKGNPHTQRTSGRLSGKLGKALQQPRVIASGRDQQIRFVNQRHLNREARHWQRLNFGAGDRGTEASPRTVEAPINLGRRPTKVRLRFDQGPRPAFTMPEGLWWEGSSKNRIDADETRRGQDAFVPFVDPRRQDPFGGTPTRGIKGYHFLDAGLVAFGEHFGPTYEELFEKWFDPEAPAPLAAGRLRGRKFEPRQLGRYRRG